MAITNGSLTALKNFSSGAQQWAASQGLDLLDPSAITLGNSTIFVPSPSSYTFLSFKMPSPGIVLTDDQAMAAAIAKLAQIGGTLVIDAGITIHLTSTVNIPSSMQIISAQGSTGGTSLIIGSMTGPMFNMTASGKVLMEGLNILDTGPSGSIVVMSGDNTTLSDCQFANVAGNSSSMVKFQGYDEVVQNCTFSNYDANAFCWEASYTQWAGLDTNINDRIVGGFAYGIGKGGLIASTGSHFIEGLAIDDWSCATAGTQIQASDVYSLYIRGGVYDGAVGSAIVLGGGVQQVTGVDIEGAYISANGIAISAAPSSGCGINDLTIQNCQIGGAGTGLYASSHAGRISLIGNNFTATSVAINLQNPAVGTLVINNAVAGAVQILDSSSVPNEVWVGNTLNGLLQVTRSTTTDTIFADNSGSANYVDSKGVLLQAPSAFLTADIQTAIAVSSVQQLPNFSSSTINPGSAAFMPPQAGQTFLDFKHPASGVTLSDDAAFAAAIARLGPTHGTLVINDGIKITLTHTVTVPYTMAIVSVASGMDVSSLITCTGNEDLFHVSASGSVVISGLNLQSGTSGSIITTGSGNTVVQDCQLTNVAGNSSPMVVIQGANQIIQNCYFSNNEASAYSWTANYTNAPTSNDVTSTVTGGWAYGVGQGGLIGGVGSALVQNFTIIDFMDITTGATQVVAGNVGNLNVQGGVYDQSSQAAFDLGVGPAQVKTVTISSSYISTATNPTTGVAIEAGPSGGAGVANLNVQDNQINFAGVGIHANSKTGNLSVSGNDFLYNGLGLDISNPTGIVDVTGNQLDFGNSLDIHGVSQAAQTYVANSFNGPMTVDQGGSSNLTFLDNIGTASYTDSIGVPLQSTAITASTGSSQFSAMSPTVIAGLSAQQIKALTSLQIAALTPGQEAVMTASQFASFNPSQAASFTSSQIADLSTTQISGFGPSFLASLTLAQIAALQPAQLQALTSLQVTELAPNKLATMTLKQLGSLSLSTEAALSTTQLADLTPLQIIALEKTGQTISAGSPTEANGVLTASGLQEMAVAVGTTGERQLVLHVSETAWHGDSQFSLTVDGAAVGGTLTASASHAAGQSQTFTVAGLYAPGPHTVGVKFLNSLTGSDGGRALFVDGMTFNGQNTGQSASLPANGTALLSTAPTTRSTAVTVNLSEDAFHGDAMAFISIDGKVQGGVQTVSASHTAGATQAMSFQLDLAPGAHTAAVTLLNGISGSPGASRNLYLDSIDVAGAHFANAAASLGSSGSSSFAFTVQPASAANGSLYVTAGAPSAMSLLVPSA